MQTLPKEVEQLFHYLQNGTSAFHVIAHTKQVLTEAGFTELHIKDNWTLTKGSRYFCSPFDTTLYAFTIGESCDLSNGIHIAGAHTDFPAIKIKPNPEIFSHGYMQLNTEVYGGPILNTFFDRPLSLAGKVVTKGDRYDRPVSHLVDLKRPAVYLPNLAIHMNRAINENGAPIDNQKHLLPILGTLNEYLKKHADALLTAESLNERSFEIWHREKFLDREQGKKILKRCGLNVEALNVYRTTEPLSYYTHTRNTPQNILILENKDPFFSMRNYLLNGHTEIFGAEIGTLIYGAGKGIIRSFQDFDLCAEPYMKHPKNTIYYFGDMDYEGIGIYENLAEKFRSRWKIIPFVPAYQAMLGKAEQIIELPETKEHQNRNISTQFFSCFDEIMVKKMEAVLDKDRYIPQEILNTADF